MYLAENLRYLRLKNGFSQDYIADIFNYKSYTTVQKWETGIAEPSVSLLSKLSKLYNETMHDMYTIDLEHADNSHKEYSKIPLLGAIAAGLPILAL